MLEIIRNHQTDYCIAIPDCPSLVEKTVSAELSQYLWKVFDVLMPIIPEKESKGNVIYVGHTRFAKENGFIGNSVENWMVCACNKALVLTGGLTNKDRGVAYSVYHFLEDNVGVRWWSWFEEYIPKAESLCLPGNYHNSGTPAFEFRNICDTFKPTSYAYVLRNRLNGWSDITDVAKIAHKDFVSRGGIKYFGLPHPSHTIPRWISSDEYYDEHPEWFAYNALTNSRPKRGQHGSLYCLTNEKLIRFTADKVMESIEKNKELAEEYGIEMPSFVSVSFADAQGHCECDKCDNIFKRAGTSGFNLRFVNEVAKLVGKKYPKIKINAFAYWDYIEPPTDDTVPEKNVTIQFADLKVDLLRDIFSDTNKEGKRLLDKWSDACAKNGTTMYIWDYYLQQYPNCMMPYFLKLATNFRYFYEKGARSCFIEHELQHVSDFYTMTQWLLAKVMEDPYQDYDALMDDFINRYYGAAAPYIKQYIELLKENLDENACRIMVFEQAMMSNYVSYKMVREGLKVLCQAEKQVENDQDRLDRVHVVMSCLYRTIALRYDEFQSIAGKYGETLSISQEDAIKYTMEYVQLNKKFYARLDEYPEHSERLIKSVDDDVAHMQRFFEKRKTNIPLPQELKQYGEENVYSVSGVDFYGLAGCGMLPDGHKVGESFAQADELGREVLKLEPDLMSIGMRVAYIAGGKDDVVPNPIRFYTEGNTENTSLALFQEDLYQDEYHLYHVGDISRVTPHSSTMFRLFSYLGYCVGLSNLYEVFPANTYGLYVSFKVTGPAYGSDGEENALYLDCVHIVRKT